MSWTCAGLDRRYGDERPGAPDYEHVYIQAYALCQQLGDTPHLFSVLTGLRQMYNARAEFQGSGSR